MKDLIEALTIFMKYKNVAWPTNCSRDVLAIMEIDRKDVSDEDHARLDELGFIWDASEDVYISYRYGTA
jgi:hypothetical protein